MANGLESTFQGLTANQQAQFPDQDALARAAQQEQLSNIGGDRFGGGRELNFDAALGNLQTGPQATTQQVSARPTDTTFLQQAQQFQQDPFARQREQSQLARETGERQTSTGVIRQPAGTTLTGEVVDRRGGTDFGQQFLSRIDETFGAFAEPLTETALQEQEQANIQAELALIDQRGQQRILEAMRAGEGRLGRTRGLATAGGTLFSPRGQSDLATAEAENQRIIQQIQGEIAAEKAAVVSGARGRGTERFEAQSERLLNEANARIGALSSAFGLSADEAASLRNQAVQIAQLTGEIGGDPTLALRRFLEDQASTQFEQGFAERQFGFQQEQFRTQTGFSEREMALAEQEAARAGATLVQQPNGGLGYFDQDTRQFVQVLAPRAPARTGGGVTGTDGFPRRDIGLADLPDAIRTAVNEGFITEEEGIRQAGLEGGISFANPIVEQAIGDLLSGVTTFEDLEFQFGKDVAEDIVQEAIGLQF